MTALPKHWPSSRRQGKRRATFKTAKIASTITCRHCGQPKRPNFRCQNCNK